MIHACPLTSCSTGMPSRIRLVDQVSTRVEYDTQQFDVDYSINDIVIRAQSGGRITIRQKNQQVPYKATILGGLVLEEQREGDIDYEPFFFIDWQEEYAVPELHFKERPLRIRRRYRQGQRIELGVDQAVRYCILYGDGVNAVFDRRDDGAEHSDGFDFKFSTGFYGCFWRDHDDSYTLKFKGDRLAADEDDLRSQSKFVVSRSKYSGMLQLVLQEEAVVCIA